MFWLRTGSIIMFLGVALGAFGAHGLKGKISDEMMQNWHTAVEYHFVHGLGLLVVGWLSTLKPDVAMIRAVGWMFVVGIVLFSGSLYLMALTGERKLGMITPFGGLSLLVGWVCLAIRAR